MVTGAVWTASLYFNDGAVAKYRTEEVTWWLGPAAICAYVAVSLLWFCVVFGAVYAIMKPRYRMQVRHAIKPVVVSPTTGTTVV
jgi:hypothetical protein